MKSDITQTDHYISIIIVSKGRHDQLLETTTSLLRNIDGAKKVEVIIIEETNIHQPITTNNIKYIRIPEQNWGFGYVRNLALEKAAGSIIVFVDDDITFSEGWLIKLTAPFVDEEVGAVGGSILPDLSVINQVGKCISFLGFPAGGLERYLAADGRHRETNLISTGNCAFRAELARNIGGFDLLMRWGGEDQDFFSRISSLSKCIFASEAIVYHRQRDSLKEVFQWFVRRGKGEFYRRCKQTNPLSALLLPLRSNFILKMVIILIVAALLNSFSPVLSVIFLGCTVLSWNHLLWRRGMKLFTKKRDVTDGVMINEIRKSITSNEVKTVLFAVKFFMDLGHEIGKLTGFCRFYFHRTFRKPIILTFHHIGKPNQDCSHIKESRYYYSKEKFEILTNRIIKEGILIVPVSDVVKRLNHCPNSLFFERIACITFDDAYRSVYDMLSVLLIGRDFPCTVFVPSALVGDYNRWDNRESSGKAILMDWNQLRTLFLAGVEIGSHTRNHANLETIPFSILEEEIIMSRDDIKRNIPEYGERGILFSYPYGAYNSKIIDVVKRAGFCGAVANYQGTIRPRTDIWQLPRFTVFSEDDWDDISSRLKNMLVREFAREIKDSIYRRGRS